VPIKLMRPRYVSPELADLKRLADEAGGLFRLAKSGCFQSNVDYFMELQISRMKVLPSFAAQMTSAQMRDHDDLWKARVDHRDLQRVQARVQLTDARATLDQAVSRYRAAKIEGNDGQNPREQVARHGHAASAGRPAAVAACWAAPPLSVFAHSAKLQTAPWP
jgi:hypothetical protein